MFSPGAVAAPSDVRNRSVPMAMPWAPVSSPLRGFKNGAPGIRVTPLFLTTVRVFLASTQVDAVALRPAAAVFSLPFLHAIATIPPNRQIEIYRCRA